MLSKQEHHGPLVNWNDHAGAAVLGVSGAPPANAATGGAARWKFCASLPLRDARKTWRAPPILIIAMAVIIPFVAARQMAAAEPKRVLMIHSFATAATPFTVVATAFETELAAKMGERVDVDEVSLDMARYADGEMQEAMVEYLQKRQGKWQPQLVVPIGSPANLFVATFRDRLFPETPILYTVGRPLLPPGAPGKNATYIGQEFDLPGFVQDMLQVAPATKNIEVIVGATALERRWQENFEKAVEPFKKRLKFTYYNDLAFNQMKARVSTLPPDSYIFFLLLLRDAAGVTLNADDGLQRLHAVANAPINSMFEHHMGLGIVGGRLYDIARPGREAADVAIRILHGEPPDSLSPRIFERLPPRYDSRELERWKINPNLLASDSTILFRTPTIWERYRTWIISGISIFLLQALLISGLLANLFKRRKAERSLARAGEEALHHREQINLLGRVSLLGEMTASLAHELGQPLSAIITNANAGMRYIESDKADPALLCQILGDMGADAHRAHGIIQNVRNTIKKGDSNRCRIDLNELIKNVAHVVRPDAVGSSCEVETSLAEDLPLIEGDPVQIQQVLVNLVGNALQAMRQTPPSRRKVEIRTATNGNGAVHVSVRDHGTGFSAEVRGQLFERFFTTKEKGLGMGLAIVRSIVESHGGEIEAENVADGGARFHFTLPVAKSPG
jgi:signal transduction histidine kinase